MNKNESTQFEVHDREVLANARSIMNATESPRAWAQEVIQAVKRNESRFPSDFMFQLTGPEKAEVVTNCDHLV